LLKQILGALLITERWELRQNQTVSSTNWNNIHWLHQLVASSMN